MACTGTGLCGLRALTGTIVIILMSVLMTLPGCAGRTGGSQDIVTDAAYELPIVVADSLVTSNFSDSLRYPIGDGIVAYYQRGQAPNWVVDYLWFRMSGSPRRDLYTMAQMDSLVSIGVGSDSMQVQWVTYRVGIMAESYDDLKLRARRDRPTDPPPAVIQAVRRFDAQEEE